MDTSSPYVIVVTGPTATGKTKLGVELCLELGGEVVSADSMQIYKRMSIGTAKPTEEEKRGIPHHMIDIIEPWDEYSVARYVEDAAKITDDIIARGKIPVIVGGTGLYIDSLISGRSFAGIQTDGILRQELEDEYESIGGEEMLKKLTEFDPERGAKLSPNDRKRIIRAHEIYRLTGKTITAHDEETKKIPPRYNAKIIALTFKDRQDLYNRIDLRVDEMMKMGLESEARELFTEGQSIEKTAMQAIGYREFIPYINGQADLVEVSRQIKQNSRRYAKRQLTWLRRNPSVKWILWDAKPDFAAARQVSTKYCLDSVIE